MSFQLNSINGVPMTARGFWFFPYKGAGYICNPFRACYPNKQCILLYVLWQGHVLAEFNAIAAKFKENIANLAISILLYFLWILNRSQKIPHKFQKILLPLLIPKSSFVINYQTLSYKEFIQEIRHFCC